MAFRLFRQAVLQEAFRGDDNRDSLTVAVEGKKSTRVIAAAALVLRDRGSEWAVANPRQFEKEIFRYLGWGIRIALFFLPGGPYVVIARFLAPIILSILETQFAGTSYATADYQFEEMADDARRILKEKDK